MSPQFEELPGLPTTGPMHENFSATGQGTHSEGYVVRFVSAERGPWVGNFQPGPGGISQALVHPNAKHVLVIANGQGYVVDSEKAKVISIFGGSISEVIRLSDGFVFGNGLWFERLNGDGQKWKTQRLSWDGCRNLQVVAHRLTGEAYSPLSDGWIPFSVDLETGSVTGGSYNGPAL